MYTSEAFAGCDNALEAVLFSVFIEMIKHYENEHDAHVPQAYRMKIEYPQACSNNVGRQGCHDFGTGIPL